MFTQITQPLCATQTPTLSKSLYW